MIHHGDLFDVLPTLSEASIDACVTDPPYGIGFMGKEWDTFKPSVAEKKSGLRQINKSEKWSRKEKRAANPNLKGRTVDGAISSSQIDYDRSLGGQRGFQEWTERWAREVLRVLKPGAHIVVCGAPRSYHRMACGLEDAGFVVRDGLSWLYGQGFPKSLNLGDGRGTALKPSWEPIVLAWKPFKGSIKGNVSQFGTGALNIDACRIGDERPLMARVSDGSPREFLRSEGRAAVGVQDGGRWPTNAMLDEAAAAMLDEQSGTLVSGPESDRGHRRNADAEAKRNAYGGFQGQQVTGVLYGDSGGASRFYYVAKPSREERDYGTESITARQRDESRKVGNPGGDNPRNRGLQPRGNFHPTVKPVELMRWLVKLITPIGGTVLDPFTGSGTTGMACRYELREFVGIEREAEYVQIAEARIAAVAPLFSQASA